MRTLAAIACKLCWIIPLLVAPVHAETPLQDRPRIALVLEGGGALGFAHIGAIEYLEEHRIPIDLVVGTSMGGLVGGLYASGKSPAEIRKLVNGIDWNAVLSGRTPFRDLSYRRKEDRIAFPNRLELGLKQGVKLPDALNSGHEVGLFLDQAVLPYYGQTNFDELPIRFRCVATDLTDDKKKIFAQGSLAQALRATMSIPGVFAPVTIDGHVYADGGAVDNLPVDVAKAAGADIVIAVYLDPGKAPETYSSFITTAGKTISIMIAANELHSIESADILLTADVKGFSSASFDAAEKIIPTGYAAATKRQVLLDKLSVDQDVWDRYVSARSARTRTEIPIPTFVEVKSDDPANRRAIEKGLMGELNKPINPETLDSSLTQFVGFGILNSAGYTITDKNGKPGLLISTYPKEYGPPFP